MTAEDNFFLPGVSFDLDGESVPAKDLCWAMYASCGCVCGVHRMTEDTIGEANAWKQMSGNAAMVKRDKERGFTLKMARTKSIPLDDCPHSPKWGYMPTPVPPEHSWAATRRGRVQHLVPLTPPQDEGSKDDWSHDPNDWRAKFTSLCGKVSESSMSWSRKWWALDDKVECSQCSKAAEAQVLL